MIGSRSAWSVAVALALLATPIAGFLLVRPDHALESSTPEASGLAPAATPRSRTSTSGPRSRTTSASTPSRRPHRPLRPSIDRPQLAAARSVARRFASQYAAYVGGQVIARAIADAAPELIRELSRHPPRVTPTYQQQRPSLRRLTAEPAAGTVHAVATLQDAGGPPYRLAFHLERRGRRWLVTRLSDA